MTLPSQPVSFSMDEELVFLETATRAAEHDDANILRHQLVTSPLLTYSALEHHAADFPSRALLGTSAGERVYVNTNAPSSAVICGVQGSGKSHTVSCFLECALLADSRVGRLPAPLSALVFHFDTRESGRPCEAAFLSTPAVQLSHVALPQVTVLCSPSNVNRRRRAYAPLARVRVEPLYFSEKDLTADRMLALMGCDNLDTMPLYMHTALRIIRTMGIDGFSYLEFKRTIRLERLDPKQTAMIELRLGLLDAFIEPGVRAIESYFTAGGLVLIDLTDPFLDSLTAAVLFDIVLGTFTQWQTLCGKLVVLDEAHKYLVNTDASRLTHSVSNIIRLQRHLATRVIIATQEPTVVPPTILDLASIIICHRFSSPAWCAHLARHVSAGAGAAGWAQQVMALATGTALVFAPAAAIAAARGARGAVALLGSAHLTLRVRPRLTLDGGASVLAVGRGVPAASGGSGASPPLLPTPAASESDLPAPSESDVSESEVDESEVDDDESEVDESEVDDDESAVDESDVSAPPSVAAAPRAVPARLQHLVSWLSQNSTAGTPLNLNAARSALYGHINLYVSANGQNWWAAMLDEAEKYRLIEIVNKNTSNEKLQARGEARMIRLLERGPLVYI